MNKLDKLVDKLNRDATQYSDKKEANPKVLLWNYLISPNSKPTVSVFNQLIDRFYISKTNMSVKIEKTDGSPINIGELKISLKGLNIESIETDGKDTYAIIELITKEEADKIKEEWQSTFLTK